MSDGGGKIDPDTGKYLALNECQFISAGLYYIPPETYVYHPGSGTYLALSECEFVKLEDIPEANE